MTKEQALYNFYNGFLTAYEENSVPENAALPYLTYNVITDNLGSGGTALTASLWYKGPSWTDIDAKRRTISASITRGGRMITCDGGAIWINRGQPFAQRMRDDTDASIKRILININAEFLTAE